jgi:hypothetical protein
MQKHRNMKKTILLSVLLFCLLWSGAFAQVGGSYDLTWWTIDNGAGEQSGGTYVLEGSVGQPDVGKWHGGQYDLTGGFWAVGEETSRYYLYIPYIH